MMYLPTIFAALAVFATTCLGHPVGMLFLQ